MRLHLTHLIINWQKSLVFALYEPRSSFTITDDADDTQVPHETDSVILKPC